MKHLKGGQFLIDLTSLGDISTLSVGATTSYFRWDITNLLPVVGANKLSKLLTKKFVFKILFFDEEFLIETNNIVTISGSDELIFPLVIEAEKFEIRVDCADSFDGSMIYPLIDITRIE